MGKIQARRTLVAVASGTQELLRRSAEHKRRALHYMKHAWKIRTLSRALAKALEESREASSWPGERLPVCRHMSEQVELITQRIRLETEAWAAHHTAAARTT